MSDKQVKAALKEGGKKGVDLAGIRDMGGVSFFTVCVDSPEGNMDLLKSVLEGMNKEVDETAEERKGGAGDIAKVIISAGAEQLGFICHVPKALAEKVTKEQWLEILMKPFGGEVVHEEGDEVTGVIIKKDADANKFPLKMRDDLVGQSFAFLREKSVVPPANDDDDWDPTADSGLDW
eukprot:GDKH01013328.1.p2 GENE.GDKH01013328.1~~GDKH01013328.1.p2  ORF type:complete len:178 (+),score=72.12 GDKH01013328.1:74-607(+)